MQDPIYVAFTQKEGAGKSTLTMLVVSNLRHIRRKKVLSKKKPHG